MNLFPSLFMITIGKEIQMEDLWNYLLGVWDPRFSKRLNDLEVDDVECLLQRLQSSKVCKEEGQLFGRSLEIVFLP